MALTSEGIIRSGISFTLFRTHTEYGVYHDPVKNSPTHLMRFTGLEWLDIDFYGPWGYDVRGALFAYYLMNEKNKNKIRRATELLKDKSLIRGDMDLILSLIKERSPMVIATLNDPVLGPEVGSVIAIMLCEELLPQIEEAKREHPGWKVDIVRERNNVDPGAK